MLQCKRVQITWYNKKENDGVEILATETEKWKAEINVNYWKTFINF